MLLVLFEGMLLYLEESNDKPAPCTKVAPYTLSKSLDVNYIHPARSCVSS